MGDRPYFLWDTPMSDVELRERLRDQDHEGAKAADSARQRRAQERSSWPIRRFRLGSEPNDDLRGQTTAEERLSMMWELARRVIQALTSFGAPVEAHGVRQVDFETPGTVYQIGLPPRRIDLMTSITGVEFNEAWSSRQVVEISGLPVPFLGRDAPIRNKRAARRDKDPVDLRLLTDEPPSG